MEKYYGFYSQQSVDEGFGTVIYLTPSGTEVIVTCTDKDINGPSYQWPDKEFVGEVASYLRIGIPITANQFYKKEH